MQGPQANLMPTSPPSIWEAEDWNGFHFTGSGTASMSETQQIVAYSGSLTYVNQIGDINPKSDEWQQVDDGDIGFDLALPASFVVLDEAPTSSEGSLATAVRDELAWRLTVMDWQPSLVAIQPPNNLVVTSVESVPDGVTASDYLGVLEDRWLSNYEAITNDAEIELPASYLRSWQVRLDQNFTPWSTRVDGREALLITSWLYTDQGSIDQRVYLVAATDDSVHVVSFTSSDIWANLAMFHEIILDTYQNQR